MFAELVFPLPFRNSFTYLIPKELEPLAVTGVRAAAPFGRRVLTGFIIRTSETTTVKEEIKPISDILDEKPIFTKVSLKFFEWLSEYYLCSPGEAMKLAVPYGTDVESKKKLIPYHDVIYRLLSEEKDKQSLRTKILSYLVDKDEVNFNHLQKIVKKKNIYSSIKTLEKAGAVASITQIEDSKVKIKTAKYVKLAKPVIEIYEFIPEIENRSPKQVKILLELTSKKKPLMLSDLLKKADASHSAADSLAKKGLIEIYDKEVDRKYFEEFTEENIQFKISEDQQKVITEVESSINENKFKAYLLHGITGSGKTQVYIELVKKVLDKKRTALILVPEISLTPQMTSRLLNNFGEMVTVLHSRMSLGERYDSWRRILNGKSKVVIGARSALFAPLDNLGIIVVDEEHDQSYKQHDTVPKYQARDSAIILARLNNCPVVLGSATPSIESMYNAKAGKYKLLSLPKRIDDAKLPKIEFVNVIVEKKKKRMENVFSKTLIDRIEDRLKKKEGVIILQNRRGFSTQVYCNDCGNLESCDNCSVPMVYHINKNYLQCHYCNLTKAVPNACTACGSLSIKYFGAGTERVEDELAFYFPSAAIKRIDSDSISRKSSLSKILNEFAKGEIDILVGTQMVSKGMDFTRVTLVGVISAETTLWMPDFRADERTFQLLTQVAGRSGRSKIEGEVVIQTQNEKHFALQKVLRNDYDGFYQKEIFDRETREYPPFTRLCLIETKDTSEEKAKGAITDFYKELAAYSKWIKISSPSTALIARLKGFYRFQILIKSSREKDKGGAVLRKAILSSFVEWNRKSRYKEVKILFDVDPQSLM